MKFDKQSLNETLGGISGKAGELGANVADKTKAVINKSKDSVVQVIDANGDGKVDIEDIIILGLKIPGIGIDRASFLQKEFAKRYSQEVITKAIAESPARAGISPGEIDIIADHVIQFERNCVSGISAALGAPGGAALGATVPADIIQYYGYMLRTAQKLMYLYGFPSINVEEESQQFDSETLNILTICLGVMYGVAGASKALKMMAMALAGSVEKKLLHTALTKGTIYPIVKSVAKWFEVRMTKEIFAGFFKKAIPVVGGVLGGGITYLSFKPCCDKLKLSLQDTYLSNPAHEESEEDRLVVDAEYSEIDERESI